MATSAEARCTGTFGETITCDTSFPNPDRNGAVGRVVILLPGAGVNANTAGSDPNAGSAPGGANLTTVTVLGGSFTGGQGSSIVDPPFGGVALRLREGAIGTMAGTISTNRSLSRAVLLERDTSFTVAAGGVVQVGSPSLGFARAPGVVVIGAVGDRTTIQIDGIARSFAIGAPAIGLFELDPISGSPIYYSGSVNIGRSGLVAAGGSGASTILTGGGSIDIAGTVEAEGSGAVGLTHAASTALAVTVRAGAVVRTTDAVAIQGGSGRMTLDTAGSIIGGGGVAVAFGPADDRVIIRPGATFGGAVTGGGGTDAIELAGSGAGTFGGFSGFSSLVLTGGQWTLTGTQAYAADVTLSPAAALTVAGRLRNVVAAPTNGAVTVLNDAVVEGGLRIGGTAAIAVEAGGRVESGINVAGIGNVRNRGTVRSSSGPALLFGNSDDVVLNAGTIAGGGGIAIQFGRGNDTLILETTSVITGAIDGGEGSDSIVLRAASGQIGSRALSDASFGGGAGFEILQVEGGRWLLDGPQSYPGGIRVLGGTLTTNALVTGTTVASGGTIFGGSFGGLVAGQGTVLSPGDAGAIGTIQVVDGLIQGSGSILFADILPSGASDTVTAGGSVTIQPGATLVVNGAGGTYQPGQRYVIVSAGGSLGGAFDTVTLAGATPLSARAEYGARSVQIVLGRSAAGLAALARSSNQQTVAAALAGLPATNRLASLLAFEPNDAVVVGALDQLSGEIHVGQRSSLVASVRRVEDAVAARLVSAEDGRGLWLQGLEGSGFNDGVGSTRRTTRRSSGLLGGLDLPIGDIRIGIAGGWVRDRTTIRNGSRARARSIHLGGYAGLTVDRWRMRGGLGYGWADVDARRAIAFGSLADTASSSHKTGLLHGSLEVGYAVPVGGGSIEPIAGLSALRISGERIGERGGPASLTLAIRRQNIQFSDLGARVRSGGGPFGIEATLLWRHAFNDRRPSMTASFSGSVLPFRVLGASVSHNAAVVDGGVVWRLTPGARLTLGYTGAIGSNGDEHGGRARLSFDW